MMMCVFIFSDVSMILILLGIYWTVNIWMSNNYPPSLFEGHEISPDLAEFTFGNIYNNSVRNCHNDRFFSSLVNSYTIFLNSYQLPCNFRECRISSYQMISIFKASEICFPIFFESVFSQKITDLMLIKTLSEYSSFHEKLNVSKKTIERFCSIKLLFAKDFISFSL